eukprot:4598680-Amphidinium_carterae.1
MVLPSMLLSCVSCSRIYAGTDRRYVESSSSVFYSRVFCSHIAQGLVEDGSWPADCRPQGSRPPVQDTHSLVGESTLATDPSNPLQAPNSSE